MTNNHELTHFHYRLQWPEIWVFLICVLSLLCVYTFHIDFIIADFIYSSTNWIYKQSFWAETFMHKSTKIGLILIYLILVFRLFSLIKTKVANHLIYDLFILLITIISSIALVSGLKRIFDVDCPWHLIKYGGDKAFYSLFNYPKEMMPSEHCFPASHASVGYSWIALYFYFQVKNYPHKKKVLLVILIMGMSFGIAQQIRGAHFISHDIWSLIICLSTSVIIYSIAYKKEA